MRTTIVVVLGLLLAPGLAAAQRPGAQMERRMQLEQQIRRQFLRQLAVRLELSDAQQERIRAVLAEGAEARRSLAGESVELRRDLMRAVQDDDTPMSTFEGILERLESLRERERSIERREEESLSRVLDARQRAVFLMMRMQLNDRVRRMQMGPPGRIDGPGPG